MKQQQAFWTASRWLALVTLLLLAGCNKSATFHGTAVEPPKAAAEIGGTNLDGQPFHLQALQGKLVVVFFGYTNCPDVCPLTLANMNAVYQKLGDKAQNMAFVFVSTDPARDTPQRLATYIKAFNPHFYGVQVPEAELAKVEQGYGVYAAKNTEVQGQTADKYFVDHTGYVYIIDPQGQWRLTFPYDASIDDIAADIEQLLAG